VRDNVIEITDGRDASAVKKDLIPVVRVGGDVVRERYAARTDDAGILAIYEVEPQRDTDGEIVNWVPKRKGKTEAVAPGAWSRVYTEWVEVERA
jgi:hypothetical protein